MRSFTPSELWRARELLVGVPIVLWTAFHVWEQWSAFHGRGAYLARTLTTSHGPIPLLAEIVFAILPGVVWFGLELFLRLNYKEPEALQLALAEEPEVARRLGVLARFGTWGLYAFLLYHTTWLFAPKLAGAEPLEGWMRMQGGMGSYVHATLHALGLTAFAVHVYATVPRVSIVMGWATTADARRSARLSGAIVGLLFLVLLAQLAGWHASGTSTVWPV